MPVRRRCLVKLVRAARVALVVVSLLALTAGPEATASAVPAVSRPVRVSAESLLVDASSARVPWRAELAAGGVRRMVFGDVARLPMRNDTVRYAEGDGDMPPVVGGEAEPIGPAALGWACDVHDLEYDTVREDDQLRSAYQVDCRGVEHHRVDYQFQRSSWSTWRKYTELRVGGWVSDVTNAQTVHAFCGSGGTYDYRVSYKSVVVYQGKQYGPSPAALTKKTRADCGTGVWS
jgi:hypothetical protein